MNTILNVQPIATAAYFYGMSGGRTELVDIAYNGQPLQISHTGYRGYNFTSRDGSSITFISDINVRDIHTDQQRPVAYIQTPPLYPSGYLKFADGKTYRIDNALVTWIRDTNGNFTYFTYESANERRITSATDSNGRKIQFEYDVQDSEYGICDRVIYNGVAGATRIIRIFHKQLNEVLRSGQTSSYLYALFPDFTDEGDCVLPDYNECVFRNSSNLHNPKVVSSVLYPDGRGYQFKYNSYGEIARIELPTGGANEYDYIGVGGTSNGVNLINPWQSNNTRSYIHRRLAESRTYLEGNVLVRKESIGIEKDSSDNTITIAQSFDCTVTQNSNCQNGVRLLASKHYFIGYFNPGEPFGSTPFTYNNLQTGKNYKVESLGINDNVLKRTEVDWEYGGTLYLGNFGSRGISPLVRETRNIDVPTNKVSKTRYGYDEFNNQTDIWEYDLGQGQAGGLLRYNHIDYLKGDYIAWETHIKRLPERQWISSDEQGNQKLSFTEYEYDNYNYNANHSPLISRSNVIGHNSTVFDASYLKRGNITGLTTYENAQNQTGAVSVYSQYDVLGNIVKTIDAKGTASATNYSDKFGTPDNEVRSNTAPNELNGQNSFAFATSKTQALDHTAYIQFDYWTGLVVNTEDINGVIAKTLYNDPQDRATKVVSAVGTVNEIQSNTIYDDLNRRIETKKDLYVLNDNLEKSESYYDSLGRTIETRKYESSGYIVNKTEFDALGRAKRTANPYRPLQSEQPLWSETFYDALGRVVKVKTPDNAEITTSFGGNSVTTVDQAGKTRRTLSDALGRVTRVDEPNTLNELGAIDNPAQPTSYTYNALGNLIKSTQDGQNRYFLYNSLGQLIRAKQPEQSINPALVLSDPLTGNNNWSSGVTYDLNGNVSTTINAKNVVVTNTYDVLNRILTNAYNDNSTPTVTYTYDDPNITNSKNKLTKVTNGISTTEYTSFDGLGRLLAHKQTTGGQEYTTGYKYDLSGNIIEQTYPSGRIVKTFLDNKGMLSAVKSQKTLQNSLRTYASDFVYSSSGVITSLKLGNGLYETTKLNNRLQITELGLGYTNADTNLWKVAYNYGAVDNNGNIKSQTINAGAATFTQTYQYDSLNRITEAKEISNNQQTWKQNFDYDRFGNRTGFAQIIGSEQLPINNQTSPQIDISNNQFSIGQGYEYDLNGNLIKDAQGRQFTFNGDDKQILVKNVNNQIIGQYFYDGMGKRVKKVTLSETVIFVYNALGQLLAEYSTNITNDPQINYLTNDTLGTPRILTNVEKEVTSRRDFMPFGEEINRVNYGTDNVKQKFTSYERDNEADLDFAQARMYASRFERFTGRDPVGPNLMNPQTFNKYQYCFNNPLRCVDKTGGYGIDVHLWLTTALAYAAGFSFVDSALIGIYAQETDENPNKEPFGPYFSNVGARIDYHFTSGWGRLKLWNKFKDLSASNEDSEFVIEALGDYIHASQDSFSHEGFGPIVGQAPSGFRGFEFNTTSFIAYTFGGEFYRQAELVDVTTFDPRKAEMMAGSIYAILLQAKEILNRNGRISKSDRTLVSSHEPLDYEDISEAVAEFIKAEKDTDEEIQQAFENLMQAIVDIRDREAQPNHDYG